MIAADTSTWVSFLEDEEGQDTRLFDKALADRQVVMVPVVLTELLSDPNLPSDVAETLFKRPIDRRWRWLLAALGSFASEGVGKTPQIAAGRRVDRSMLRGCGHSTAHARSGLSGVC